LRPVKIYVNRRTPGFSRGFGWGGRIRTCASRSQSPLPYPLATPHRNLIMLPIDGSYAFGFKQALRRSFRDSIFSSWHFICQVHIKARIRKLPQERTDSGLKLPDEYICLPVSLRYGKSPGPSNRKNEGFYCYGWLILRKLYIN